MKKRIAALLFAVLSLLLFTLPSQAAQTAAFTIHPQADVAAPGEEIELTVACSASVQGEISAFRLRLAFDESRVQFRSMSAKGGITKSEWESSVQGGVLTIVYLTGKSGVTIGPEATPLFSIRFVVLSDAAQGDAVFSGEFDGACDDDLRPVAADTSTAARVAVRNPDATQAALLSALLPDTGVLQPEFAPECFAYALEVPSSTDRVSFYAQPMEEGAEVKINRKTLGSMGSTTRFTATVTSPDGSQKSVYEIQVTRGQKTTGSTSGSSPNGGKASSRSSVRAGGILKSASSHTGDNNTDSTPSDSGDQAGNIGTKEEAEAFSLPSRRSEAGSFLLGVAAAVCVLGAGILLFYRKKKSNDK